MPTRSDPAGRRFLLIQVLRAVAALLVVCEHLKNDTLRIFLARDPLQSAWIEVPFSVGVDVFFVISGFVIAHSSASLHARSGSWKVFLVRRLARVVPLYWLLTAVLVVLVLVTGTIEWYAGFPAYVFGSFAFVPVQNGNGMLLPLLSLGWTLNYEMLFYAVFALFVGLRQRPALILVAATLIASVAAGRLGLVAQPALIFWTDPIVLEFLAGIGLYVLVSRGLALSGFARLALVALALGLLFIGREPNLPWRWLAWGGPAWLLVLAAVSGRRSAGGPWGHRVWDRLGDLSYAIYLSHLFVLVAVRHFLLWLQMPATPTTFVLFGALVFSITFAVSTVLHFGFERPVLRVLRRRFDPGIGTGPASSSGP